MSLTALILENSTFGESACQKGLISWVSIEYWTSLDGSARFSLVPKIRNRPSGDQYLPTDWIVASAYQTFGNSVSRRSAPPMAGMNGR